MVSNHRRRRKCCQHCIPTRIYHRKVERLEEALDDPVVCRGRGHAIADRRYYCSAPGERRGQLRVELRAISRRSLILDRARKESGAA